LLSVSEVKKYYNNVHFSQERNLMPIFKQWKTDMEGATG
ncbi:MAG: hypothetical protein ACI90V_010350, partial [Bacillariaceae sp.]